MKFKAVLAGLSALGALGGGLPAHADINVGVTLSATGPAASLGIPEKNTFALLPQTVAGQKVNYIVLDDGSDTTTAVKNTRKLIAENGEPLSIDDAMEEQDRFLRAEQYRKRTPLAVRRKQAAKEERNRLKLDLETLAVTHKARVAGRDSINGREVVVLDVEPAGKMRKPKNRNQWARILAGRMSLDTVTGHPVRAEMRQLIEWDMQPKGNTTLFEWIWMEGAWLISSICNTEPAVGGGVMVTEQRYSSYSRFQADIKLTYQDIP